MLTTGRTSLPGSPTSPSLPTTRTTQTPDFTSGAVICPLPRSLPRRCCGTFRNIFLSVEWGETPRQNSMQFEEAGQLRVMPLQVIAQPVCWQLPEVLWHFQ